MEEIRGGLLKMIGKVEASKDWYAGTETDGAWVGRVIMCGHKSYIGRGIIWAGGGFSPRRQPYRNKIRRGKSRKAM